MAVKILKEHEIGYGMLVEHDSGIITRDQNTKIITELTQRQFDFSKPIIIYATLQKYGVQNRNGRIYPEKILRREVQRYINEVINKNASYHELDHPDDSVVSLQGGSPHRILELFWKGNALIGKLEIMVSRGYRESGVISCHGDMVAHYLEYGQTLGISSRGLGTLKKVNGQNIVQDDFELVCWDIVSNPSTYGSYLYETPDEFEKYNEEFGEVQKTSYTSNPKEKLMNSLRMFNK